MFADDFFRLAHHDVTGKPRLHPRAVAIGCAAGLLGELLSERRIGVSADRVTVTDRNPPPDALMHVVVDQLMAEAGRRHSVRTWLTFLGGQAPDQIGQRLARGGHVRPQPVRRLGRRTAVWYVPVDMNVAAAPWALLSNRLRRREQLGYEALCLAGLCLATGLDGFLLDGAPADTSDYLHREVSCLWPPARELLFHTQAAIGEAVLAHRT